MPASAASSKESARQASEVKAVSGSAAVAPCPKPLVPPIKIAVGKTITQPKEMSPVAPPQEIDRPELLGSLTTEQQQRTSARVIKKLRLEPQPPLKRSDADEVPDSDTPSKVDEKDLKFPTVKQRMPKALWSTDEKSLFFEALNEYGKDFDAVTSYICAKMKKKGMPDANLKTKTQVSHFYYRTWHKLSKHVRFDENVKKVAQELYALINYGELRKKLVSVNEKTCGRLGDMVLDGSMVVRIRGRNLRVRTPMCRALRRLNQITERLCGTRVCSGARVSLRARDAAAWARVQAAAHNPRAALQLSPATRLQRLLVALQRRWTPNTYTSKPKMEVDREEEVNDRQCDEADTSENHLNLEVDRVIVEEQKTKKLALHVGPCASAELHLPVASPAEALSSQKICFSSYLERIQDQTNAKLRTPKRQRKDSATEKDKELESKKIKTEDIDDKLINIEETAIDGIELMANYKNMIEYEHSDDIKDEAPEEDLERDKEMSEKEKDSFSEMEDDGFLCNKSDTDNESDGRCGKERKFDNLKVKFRIRQKKRGGSVYTLVTEEVKDEKDREDKQDAEKMETEKPDVEKLEKPEAEKPEKPEVEKPDIDVEMALRQIRRGWSAKDAGDLTIGDLYLMFGNRSKLELDYWWAEPTSPLPQPQKPAEPDKEGRPERNDKERPVDDEKEEIFSPKNSADSNDGSADERKSQTGMTRRDPSTTTRRIFSPKNSADSNDVSADERKNEPLLSPEHKSSTSTLKLVSKLVNRPNPPQTSQTGFSLLSERLKRLLALAGNPHCGGTRRRPPAPPAPPAPPDSTLFRHPPPIAPRPEKSRCAPLDLEDLPRGRRGRSRCAERRIVVQRLLPLLPKLPPPSTLIPVKIVPDSPPAPPKILPKPPPTSTSDLSIFYVLSESNGQFYFHDGDRRIPIAQLPSKEKEESEEDVNPKREVLDVDDDDDGKEAIAHNDSSLHQGKQEPEMIISDKTGEPDMGSFLPSESMCLSPSRLLRDSPWLEGSVQDFSLSSFLSHLEARAPPDSAVDSQLHSLLAESSVDYIAKFADLAAEVTDEADPLATP